MSAGVLTSFGSRSVASLPVEVPDVTVSVSVRTDRQRLFQILTVAEYMEAWLAIPDTRPDNRLCVTRDEDGFRIDHFRSRQIDFTISGLYRTCRRGKLHFTWRKDTPFSSSMSDVLIRLQGDFERTKVSVRHAGLRSNDDRTWHHDFWENSMRRLCTLF
jgi:uncharacterized protein YndB with AHSA1/START domain